MSTKELIKKYFAAIHGGGWEEFVADDFTFVNSNLDRVAHGKKAYLEGAGRFFGFTTSVEVKQMVIDGDHIAVLARYQIKAPTGKTGVCDVAEFLTVKGDKLTASSIFFDTKAFDELFV